MTRSLSSLVTGVAILALVASGALAGASSAMAGQLEGSDAGPAAITIVPADPQPVVAGHEGDVLLRVSMGMPAKMPAVTKARVGGSAKSAKAAKGRQLAKRHRTA